METEYHGGPVAGGTFPAEIWHDFMTAWRSQIRDSRADAARPPQATAPDDRDARSRPPAAGRPEHAARTAEQPTEHGTPRTSGDHGHRAATAARRGARARDAAARRRRAGDAGSAPAGADAHAAADRRRRHGGGATPERREPRR